MSVNKVILLGNVGKDPEVKSLPNSNKVVNFSIATSESYKDKNGEKQTNTEWTNVVFFGPAVDVIEKYVKKGSSIYVEGKLKTRSYDDKDGVKRYVTEVIGSEFSFTGGGKGEAKDSTDKVSKTSTKPVAAPVEDESELPF